MSKKLEAVLGRERRGRMPLSKLSAARPETMRDQWYSILACCGTVKEHSLREIMHLLRLIFTPGSPGLPKECRPDAQVRSLHEVERALCWSLLIQIALDATCPEGCLCLATSAEC